MMKLKIRENYQLLIWLGVLVAVIGLSILVNSFLSNVPDDGIRGSFNSDQLEDEFASEDLSYPGNINTKEEEISKRMLDENYVDSSSDVKATSPPKEIISETVPQAPPSVQTIQVEYKPQNPSSPKFPSFTLTDLSGNSVSLSDYRGKVVVLNFWASWCPPCRQEMPELQALHNEFSQGDNAVFLALNMVDGVRETKANAEKFLKDNGYTFTNLIDERSSFSNRLGITSIPTTFILDRAGHVHDSILGATTKSRILKAVNEVV
jgi:thiol-disulfide isomerase/thioredoxin